MTLSHGWPLIIAGLIGEGKGRFSFALDSVTKSLFFSCKTCTTPAESNSNKGPHSYEPVFQVLGT